MNEKIKKLQEFFPETNIKWKITATTQDKSKGLAVPYIDTRTIQRRLDDVLGVNGWKTSYREIEGGFICSLSLKLEDQWITKEDGADKTDYEKIKGGISSAFKRAASNCFGIGRYIYDIPSQWIKIKKQGKFYIPDEEIKIPIKYLLESKNDLSRYLNMKMTKGKYLNWSLEEIIKKEPDYLNHILNKSNQVSSELVEACNILKRRLMIS